MTCEPGALAALVHLAGLAAGLWTLWRWRRQLTAATWHCRCGSPVALAATCTTTASGPLPAAGAAGLATLAAFALPTFRRSVAALIDWFTLLFFTGCAIIIWVIWIAMQTGVPAKPAANVAQLAPGFEPSFSLMAFAVGARSPRWPGSGWCDGAPAGTGPRIWKSLVLPAGGAALCWLLLMTLWLPLLDYARSYAPQVRQVATRRQPGCVEVSASQRPDRGAPVPRPLQPAPPAPQAGCPWLLVDTDGPGQP